MLASLKRLAPGPPDAADPRRILVFGLQQLMPGDPALVLAGEERGDPQVLAQIRAEAVARPAAAGADTWHWIGGVLHGDLGFSWRIREPVGALILTKLPVTFQLATMAFLIALLIGVPAGIISAVKRDTAGGLAGQRHRAVPGSPRRISGSASC